MSETVKRYALDYGDWDGWRNAPSLVEAQDGEFVKYEDFAALEAERDQLKEKLDCLEDEPACVGCGDGLRNQELQAANAKLRSIFCEAHDPLDGDIKTCPCCEAVHQAELAAKLKADVERLTREREGLEVVIRNQNKRLTELLMKQALAGPVEAEPEQLPQFEDIIGLLQEPEPGKETT